MITYTMANLCFPRSTKESEEFMSTKPEIVSNKIRFARNGYHVEALIDPFNLPSKMSRIRQVQREIIKPAVSLVSADLETIDDMLPELKRLAEADIIHDSLHYGCGVSDEKYEGGPIKIFKVYDYSIPFPTHDGLGNKLFSRVLWYKGVNERIIPPENRDLIGLAAYVNQENKKLAHVEGNTLRQAVERAVEIYSLSDRLRKL